VGRSEGACARADGELVPPGHLSWHRPSVPQSGLAMEPRRVWRLAARSAEPSVSATGRVCCAFTLLRLRMHLSLTTEGATVGCEDGAPEGV
jgi:hypothetical protein